MAKKSNTKIIFGILLLAGAGFMWWKSKQVDTDEVQFDDPTSNPSGATDAWGNPIEVGYDPRFDVRTAYDPLKVLTVSQTKVNPLNFTVLTNNQST